MSFRWALFTCMAAVAATGLPNVAAAQTQYVFCYTDENYVEPSRVLGITELLVVESGYLDDDDLRGAWIGSPQRLLAPSNAGSMGNACYSFDNEKRARERYADVMARYPFGTISPWRVPASLITVPKPVSSQRPPVVAEASPPKEDFAAKQAAYEAQLIEHQRSLAERERAIADAAAKHAAARESAELELARHNKEMAEHRDKVAQMERDAVRIRAEWASRAAGIEPKEPEEERIPFREGVVLCRQASPEARSFQCQGPLQNISTPLEDPRTSAALGMACGSDKSIRDLGMVSGYRVFGCGFGIHPTASDYPGNRDVPARLGIDFIPGRGTYSCPKSKLAYCRE